VGKDPPLADLTGCFVHSDRNAVYKQGLSLFGGLGRGGSPMTRIVVTADTRGSDEQRILLDEEVRPEHMSDEHCASQLLERLGWAVTDAERAPAVAAH
jgi:hypothetical protein